jgi:hypothetical protein
MAQRANGVVVAGMPVLLHGLAGELAILGYAFIFFCAIDLLDVGKFEKLATVVRCRFRGKQELVTPPA